MQTIELVMTKLHSELMNIRIWCQSYTATALIWTFCSCGWCSCILFISLCGWIEISQWVVLGDWVYISSVMRLMLFNHKKKTTPKHYHRKNNKCRNQSCFFLYHFTVSRESKSNTISLCENECRIEDDSLLFFLSLN